MIGITVYCMSLKSLFSQELPLPKHQEESVLRSFEDQATKKSHSAKLYEVFVEVVGSNSYNFALLL